MIVHIDCEICNHTKTEERDLDEELRRDPFAKERCSRCREYMRQRAVFIKAKLAVRSRWPRWMREWRYGLDFDDLQGHKIKYDLPLEFVAPRNYVPAPDVKPLKADSAPATDISALAAVIVQGFDTAKDKDVAVSMTYRRVGDVVDASGTIEVLDVKKVESKVNWDQVQDALNRADQALMDTQLSEPMSMAGCSDEDVAAANETFAGEAIQTPNYIRRCLECEPPRGYASIDANGRISDPDGPLERLNHTATSQREWLMAASENKLNQLGFLWIALQHALRKYPDADIRTAIGDDQLYSEVREIMVGDKRGKRN